MNHVKARAAGILAALALSLLPAGAGTAYAGTATADASAARTSQARGIPLPIGTWETEIDFGGGQMVKVSQAYTWKGELCHLSVAEGARSYGKGSWRPTGPNRFSYEVVESFYDTEGTYHGRSEMRGNAVLVGGTFHTYHHSHVFDVDGDSVSESEGWITFDRVSRGNPDCPDEL